MRGALTILAFGIAAVLLAAPVLGSNSPRPTEAPQTTGWQFERTITAGNVLTAVAFLVGIVGAYAAFRARLATLELKVDTLWDAWVQDARTRRHEE